jgi:hypothetical protein
MKRLALIAAVVIALWVIALIVLDFALADREASRIADRVGESLHARSTIAASDLALVRGRLALYGLAVTRDDEVGHLALDVREIRCELPPAGYALVDSECRELAIAGPRMQVSSAALFHLENPKRPPIRARRVVIDDASLEFSPSAFAPSLGRVAIVIDHAEAGATIFRTPLSWLFALGELQAHVDMPAGLAIDLRYRAGTLTAAGTLFGATPVSIPVSIPSADSASDAHEEMALLLRTAEHIATDLVAKRAEDWLHSKLH